MPCRMFSSVFAPKPFMPFRRPALIASARSGTDAMPSSWYSTQAFFGPSPEIDIISSTPGGIFARRSSTAWIEPVSRNSWTFSAIDFPTFGMPCRPLRSMPEMSSW